MTPPLRVLHVTAVETSNYYLNTLAEFTHPTEVRFFAVTLSQPGTFLEDMRLRGVECWALPLPGRHGYPRAALSLSRLVTETRADVVHGHLFEPSVTAALAAAHAHRPLAPTRHHSDAVHRIPSVLRRSAYLFVERALNRRAVRIIAPSERVRDVLITREGVAPTKVSLIPYPQTAARFSGLRASDQVRHELGIGSSLAIACISRLHPEKGHSVLFRALASLVSAGWDLRLYLLGTGTHSERLRLEGEIAGLGLQRVVTFLGWRTDALSIAAAVDVIVHPSLHEALPSAVVEAVMLEKPIVASDVSGVRDILGCDDYGRVVPPGDPDALAGALAETLSDLPGARLRARNGRRHILDYMDARRVAEAHLECYRAAAGVRIIA